MDIRKSVPLIASPQTIGSAPGYYSVTIIAMGISGSHDLRIDVAVKSGQDLAIDASPGLLKIAELASALTTITAHSEISFAENISFALQVPKGVNATQF